MYHGLPPGPTVNLMEKIFQQWPNGNIQHLPMTNEMWIEFFHGTQHHQMN